MMIILHLILHSTVHTYDFHIFITSPSSFHGFITNQFNDLLSVGLLAYADHDRYCRGQGFESRTSLNFFRLSFRNCKSCVCNCDDHPLHSSHMSFSCIHNFNKLLVTTKLNSCIPLFFPYDSRIHPHKNRKFRSRWLLKFPHHSLVFSSHPTHHHEK